MSKERPILFSAPMVRAILDGEKTQTRRIVKPRKDISFGCLLSPSELAGEVDSGVMDNCPWRPGDTLWVRERCELTTEECEVGCLNIRYLADGKLRDVGTLPGDTPGLVNWINGRWSRPSIYMSRWASRITLEIVRVRVERLQDISQEDAIAEGSPPSHPSIDRISREYGHTDFTRSWYAQLWEQINGAGSWDKNPFVWVIEFKIVRK